MHNHPPDKWWQHKKTKARKYKLSKPFENIWIGSDPQDGYTPEDAHKFDAILNVSDSECAFFYPSRPGQRMYWSPLNEMGYWGYAHFFYTKKILDFHYDRGETVLVHCHAGAYRSVRTGIWWMVSRGYTLEEAYALDWGEPLDELRKKDHWEYSLNCDIIKGNTPKNLPKLYARMAASSQTYALGGLCLHGKDGKDEDLLDTTSDVLSTEERARWKQHARLRWWREFKYWVNEQKARFWRWRKGLIKIKLGYCWQVCKPENEQRIREEFEANQLMYVARLKEEQALKGNELI